MSNNLNLIRTFVDGNFHGFDNLQKVRELLNEAREIAKCKQETEKADHMIYAYFDLDKDGILITARFYSGVAKTDEEFESIALLERANIYAIHNHK